MPYIGAGIQRFNTADGLTVNGNAEVTGTTALTGNATAAGTLDVTGAITSSAGATITTADNNPQLILKSTDADASSGPILQLFRDSASPADSDVLGQLKYIGRNDAAEEIVYGKIDVVLNDASDGTEDAEMRFLVATAGDNPNALKLGSTATVFNDSSKDVDFRVESNGNANMLFVDGGNDFVGIGTDSPGHLLHLKNNNPTIRLEDSDGASNIYGMVQSDGSGSVYINADDGNNGGSSKISFFVDGTDRARITSGGALLVNQTTNPAGNMFRVTETAGNSTTTIMTTSTSYATTLEGGFVQRAGNSAYSFQLYYSSGGGNLKFNFRGDGEAFADGSFTGGGADYAEYFEWEDGNSSNEDRRGYSVVLVNNKIRKATSSDAAADIIGVVSANPSAVGDAAWNNWSGKYLRDDFGSYVIETHTSTKWSEDVTDEDGIVTTKQHDYETDQIPSDVTVPADAVVYTKDDKGNILTRRKINPDYDETLTYSPREDRQEWDTIGMVGKLRLRAGQPTGDRWIKMRDISDSVEEWLVR